MEYFWLHTDIKYQAPADLPKTVNQSIVISRVCVVHRLFLFIKIDIGEQQFAYGVRGKFKFPGNISGVLQGEKK